MTTKLPTAGRALRGATLALTLLLLCALLGLCAVTALWRAERDTLTQELTQTREALALLEAEPVVPPEQGAITREEFEYWLTECSPGYEFVQRFYTDRIFYPEGNRLVWQMIDDVIPRHDYDLEQIQRLENGELTYDGAIKGIDVSEYQGVIDWEKVAADGVEFAIMRAGYRGYGNGKVVADRYFEDNMRGAQKAGIKLGAYFFSQAIDENEAREEARFLLEQCGDYSLDYPLVLDIEDATGPNGRAEQLTQEQFTAIALAFADEVRANGQEPMIYANTRWLLTRLSLEKLSAADCPIWLAQYVRYPFFPYRFEMLQYTHKGRVAGIEGDVDLNLHFAPQGG